MNQPPVGIELYNGDFGMSAVYGYAPRPGYTVGGAQSLLTACKQSTLTPYAAFDGVCLHARQSTGVLKMYSNNVLRKTITDASNTFFDMRQQAVYLGIGYVEANGITTAYYGNQFVEVWNVNDCSKSFALALSNRLGTLY